MPLTIREQIAVFLEDVLSAIDGVTVLREPQDDFTEDQLPALGILLGDERSEPGETIDVESSHLELPIVGQVTGNDGKAASTAANALYGAVLTAVMADPTLGGLAVDTTKTSLTTTSNAGSDGEPARRGFVLSFDIWVRTLAADPTQLAPG